MPSIRLPDFLRSGLGPFKFRAVSCFTSMQSARNASPTLWCNEGIMNVDEEPFLLIYRPLQNLDRVISVKADGLSGFYRSPTPLHDQLIAGRRVNELQPRLQGARSHTDQAA